MYVCVSMRICTHTQIRISIPWPGAAPGSTGRQAFGFRKGSKSHPRKHRGMCIRKKKKKKLSIDLRQCELAARENVEGQPAEGVGHSRHSRGNIEGRHSYRGGRNRVCSEKREEILLKSERISTIRIVGIHRAETTIRRRWA